ncbi:hypothetical protein [Pseudomonas sp. UV AK001]|uniref:hypothetical protein n=1 Tax=Pseudomonas sp. UV AK001 TaxID=3384791 RepID=UPI0038D4EDCE
MFKNGMGRLIHPLTLFILVLITACFTAPLGTPQLAAFAKDFLPAAATLIAAYAGVWFGASLTRAAALEEERKRRIGIGARAMFTLWRQVNVVAQIQIDYVNEYRDSPSAPIGLPPISYPMDETGRLNIDGLAFFLDLGNAQILETLSIAEQRFLDAIDTIKRRSTLHLVEVQPVLERIIPKGGPLPYAVLEAELGPRLFSLLIAQTRSLIVKVDDAVITLDKAATELYAALKKEFPDAKFPQPSLPIVE